MITRVTRQMSAETVADQMNLVEILQAKLFLRIKVRYSFELQRRFQDS